MKFRTDCFKWLQCFKKCGESCWYSWKTACLGPLGTTGCVEWWESFESGFVALSCIASGLTLGSVPTCQSAATLHQSFPEPPPTSSHWAKHYYSSLQSY